MTDRPLRPNPGRTVAVLVVGTLAVSTAAPLIDLAAVPALSLAAWRCLLCGLAFGGLWAAGRTATPGLRRHLPRLILAAALLAAHFGLWISAFDHTSYAAAVMLLVTQPVFGALVGRVALGERLTRRMLIGIVGATIGLGLLVHADRADLGHLFGDALAVAGTLALALFYLVVRPLRDDLPFAPFMTLTYGIGGVLLAAAAGLTGAALTGFLHPDWALVVALAFVPTVVGHACFNWCVPRVRFFTLNLVIVLEPALALLLGVALLGERPTTLQVVGGCVLGAAVVAGLGGSGLGGSDLGGSDLGGSDLGGSDLRGRGRNSTGSTTD